MSTGRVRGAYYKARYGGGRGRGGSQGSGPSNHGQAQQQQQSFGNEHLELSRAGGPLKDWAQLEADLRSIDQQQYGAYKRLLGKYNHVAPQFTLSVDHVQGDAYAAPSRVRAIMPWKETVFPDQYLTSEVRRIALCDFVSRIAGKFIQTKQLDQSVAKNGGGGWSGPKGGAFSINAPGQEIIPRTSALITGNQSIELRFTVSLPAAGRTVLGQQAYQILAVNLVDVVKQSLMYANIDQKQLATHISSAETQDSLRSQLEEHGLIGFVANGSVLPRASGASQAPMGGEVVVFTSPKELELSLTASTGASYTGMGIPKGVTMLTGGGFHGKSTLLEALELGVYNHIPGDGRETTVTDPTAFKIRAEDGRSVNKTDISPFISTLPGGRDTKAFYTSDASGSTSMAANIQEALEAGCKTLLIDEDSSATNLLVRDARMQALIRHEPITPLVSKARALYSQHGVSTIIVIGGLGDWLAVADNVVSMESYVPRCITQRAQEVLSQFPSTIVQDDNYGSPPQRMFRVDLEGLRPPFAPRNKFITMNSHTKDAVDDPSRAESGVDLAGLDQLVEIGQSRTAALLLQRISKITATRALTLREIVAQLDEIVGVNKCLPTSLDGGDLVGVRQLELGATLSRLRGLALRVDKAA